MTSTRNCTAKTPRSSRPKKVTSRAAARPDDDDQHKMVKPIQQMKQLIASAGGTGATLNDQLSYVHNQTPTFDAFLDFENTSKNRFENVPLFDHSRVIIDDDFSGPTVNDKGKAGESLGNYYHASHVSGFDRQHQYIMAQAPFSNPDQINFWRLVWQEWPSVIVIMCDQFPEMTKKEINHLGGPHRLLNHFHTYSCSFFPTPAEPIKSYPSIGMTVKLEDGFKNLHSTDIFDVHITMAQSKDPEIKVKVFHFKGWEKDNELPEPFGRFINNATVAARQIEVKQNRNLAPMMLVCSSGIHR